MKILVTGGAGFIGHHLVRRLLAAEHQVCVLDDFSSGSRANLPRHPALEVIQGCVTDRAILGHVARGSDRIFHLASVVGQLSVVRQPEWAVEVSRGSLQNFNEVAPETPLILFSSSAVYGLTGDEPCHEESRVDDDTARAYDGGGMGYGYGKWVSEKLAARRAAGTWLVVRPFNVIGPGQVGTYGMVVPRLVRAALAGEPYTIYGSGDQSRSFCDVQAFVDHLLALATAWTSGRAAHHTYNLGSGTETSITELADTIDSVLQVANMRCYVPFSEIYPGKQDVARRRPGLDRIHTLLGPLKWPPLEQTIAAIRDSICTLQQSPRSTAAE